MQPLRRQFVIDNHLGRFTKALNHLHALQSFGEMKEYTIRHELYKEALALYKYEDDKFDGLMALFAEHLEGRSQFKEAGIGTGSLSVLDTK
jgi:elongator complex protein 1